MIPKGLHHVSSITASIIDNHEFYTDVLGLRLVKKTVNQDDTSMYHLFYADYAGHPGTDITFFEITGAPKYQPGSNGISRTYFRVPSQEALEFFRTRFEEKNVRHEGITEEFGKTIMKFEDHEKQRLALMVDQQGPKHPNIHPEIPEAHALTSIGAVELSIQYLKPMVQFFELLGGVSDHPYNDEDTAVEMKFGDDSLYLYEKRTSQLEKEGYGSVHHFSLRVADEEALLNIKEKVDHEKWLNSGIVDRYYFKALYITTVGGITVELSTEGPGFDIDEPIDSLGEKLSLPPAIEEQRDFIEMYLTPIN